MEWVGLTYDENKLIEDVIYHREVEKLEIYLEKVLGKKLFRVEQKLKYENNRLIMEVVRYGNSNNYVLVQGG